MPYPVYKKRKSSAGRREDLDNIYFRSKQEANYARYLNRCIKLKQMWKWEFEPDTFWFLAIKRGTRSYKPDFKVWPEVDNEERFYYVEVKGYMNAKSKTKLKRMKKYHPTVTVIVVDDPELRLIQGTYAQFLPLWEY